MDIIPVSQCVNHPIVWSWPPTHFELGLVTDGQTQLNVTLLVLCLPEDFTSFLSSWKLFVSMLSILLLDTVHAPTLSILPFAWQHNLESSCTDLFMLVLACLSPELSNTPVIGFA